MRHANFLQDMRVDLWREYANRLESLCTELSKESEGWPYNHSIQQLTRNYAKEVMSIKAFVQARTDAISKVHNEYLNTDWEEQDVEIFFIVELLDWIKMLKFPVELLSRGFTIGISAIDLHEEAIMEMGFTASYMQGVVATLELMGSKVS